MLSSYTFPFPLPKQSLGRRGRVIFIFDFVCSPHILFLLPFPSRAWEGGEGYSLSLTLYIVLIYFSFSPSQAELGKEGKGYYLYLTLCIVLICFSFLLPKQSLGRRVRVIFIFYFLFPFPSGAWKGGERLYYFDFTSYRQQLQSRRFLRCRHLSSARLLTAARHRDSVPALHRAAI